MLLISHRGNTTGPSPTLENKPEYILAAMDQGFEVEIDVWMVDGVVALGHDKPQHTVSVDFLREHHNHLWLHCKNLDALYVFGTSDFKAFAHNGDPFVLTTNNKIWTYPGKPLCPSSIVVLQENTLRDFGYTVEDLRSCHGICSDDVAGLKALLHKSW